MVITVKAARVNSGLTQRDAAKRLGVSISTYNKLENSPDLMRIGFARRVADLFGIDIDSLFLGHSYTSSEESTSPNPRYRRSDGSVLHVEKGIGDTYATFPEGSRHRVKSPALPVRDTFAAAQSDLDAYAARHGLEAAR